MHWKIEQILWALVVAAHLVLLIVLLGRDRAARFPWFTITIALSTGRLIADHLLHGKLTTVAFYWQSYIAMAMEGALGILVLIELARRVFSSGKAGLKLRASGWAAGSIVILLLAATAVWAWGRPWPTWDQLHAEPSQFALLLTVVFSLKIFQLSNLLTLELGLLLLAVGKRFGFGWRSYPQSIAIGLSTRAAGVLAVQGIEDILRHSVHYTTVEERAAIVERLGRLFSNLENAQATLWFLVLAWWIAWLWRDEAGASTGPAEVAEPMLIDPPQ